MVLVRGGRVKDLPGVRYHIVRGSSIPSVSMTVNRGVPSMGAKKPKKIHNPTAIVKWQEDVEQIDGIFNLTLSITVRWWLASLRR